MSRPRFLEPLRMLRFAEVFPDREIVSTLSRQLSWSHFIEIIPPKNDLQRHYAEMCRVERWSVRTLCLLEQVRHGDRVAFEQLFGRHRNYLCQFGRK
jgi:DUF1016 N-terminal domain